MQDCIKKIKIKQSLKGLKNIQVDIQNQEDKREEEKESLADFFKNFSLFIFTVKTQLKGHATLPVTWFRRVMPL